MLLHYASSGHLGLAAASHGKEQPQYVGSRNRDWSGSSGKPRNWPRPRVDGRYVPSALDAIIVRMAVKSADARVQHAFAMPSARDYGDKYLDHLIENIKAAAQSVRRSAGLAILLVMAFFLIAGAKTSELSLGPLKLTDVSSVLALLPALAAWSHYEYVANAYARLRYEYMKDALVGELYPTLYANDLEAFLSPPTLQAWGTDPTQLLPRERLGWESRALDALGNVVIFGFTLGLIVFLTYAYVRLLMHTRANVYVVLFSAVFSAANLARALLTVWEQRRQGWWIL